MTIYLVRHASAGTRRGGDPDDINRELDVKGTRQAAALADHLAGTPLTTIRSSPAPRCVQTVTPLAEQLGLEVETTDGLLEGVSIETAWALLEHTAHAGSHAVLCSHGDVIPELVSRAYNRGMEIPTASGCSKGSIWALDWDGERFHRGTYEPKPAATDPV